MYIYTEIIIKREFERERGIIEGETVKEVTPNNRPILKLQHMSKADIIIHYHV